MANHAAVITVEQGSTGGFGALVLHHLANSGKLDHGGAIRTMTLPDRVIDQAKPEQMYAVAGLTAADLAATVRSAHKPPFRAKIIKMS